jgi:hypothetical protein
MRKLAALSIFSLWPLAVSAAENSSVYTKFDLDTCRVVEQGDEFTYAGTWACDGHQGIDIVQASSDDRSYVGFGKTGRTHCAFAKTFFPLNSALSPIEWRLKDGIPIAAIERWSVVKDEEGNSVTWLVVNALKADQSCHVHYVAGSFPTPMNKRGGRLTIWPRASIARRMCRRSIRWWGRRRFSCRRAGIW